MPTNRAKAETETEPVKVEAEISMYSNLKFLASFYAPYLLNHDALFLLKDNFLFHL